MDEQLWIMHLEVDEVGKHFQKIIIRTVYDIKELYLERAMKEIKENILYQQLGNRKLSFDIHRVSSLLKSFFLRMSCEEKKMMKSEVTGIRLPMCTRFQKRLWLYDYQVQRLANYKSYTLSREQSVIQINI